MLSMMFIVIGVIAAILLLSLIPKVPARATKVALTVVAGSFTVGSLSLASFNPAVSMALLVLGVLPAGEAWAHFVPQLLAAVLAALTFAVLNPDDP